MANVKHRYLSSIEDDSIEVSKLFQDVEIRLSNHLGTEEKGYIVIDVSTSIRLVKELRKIISEIKSEEVSNG